MQTSLTIDELLKILVSFNTISALPNIEMIDFIRDYINGYGIDTNIQLLKRILNHRNFFEAKFDIGWYDRLNS